MGSDLNFARYYSHASNRTLFFGRPHLGITPQKEAPQLKFCSLKAVLIPVVEDNIIVNGGKNC